MLRKLTRRVLLWWWTKHLCPLVSVFLHISLLTTYRKYDWNATSYCLAAVELRRFTQEQVFLAIALPAEHRGSIQQYLHRITSRKRCNDLPLLCVNGWLRSGSRWGDRTRSVRSVHADVCTGGIFMRMRYGTTESYQTGSQRCKEIKDRALCLKYVQR